MENKDDEMSKNQTKRLCRTNYFCQKNIPEADNYFPVVGD